MYCINCGKKMDDSALFCDRCGAPLYPSSKKTTDRKKENRRFYAICGVVCVLFCFGICYFLKVRPNIEAENGYIEAEEEATAEVNGDSLKKIEVTRSTEVVEEEQYDEDAELAKAEECLNNFIGYVVTSDFYSMWNLVPNGEILLWESVGYNKEDVANYFNCFTQITELNKNETVNIQYDDVEKYLAEELSVSDIFAAASDEDIEYLDGIEIIYSFQGVKLINGEAVQSGILPFIPEDDIKIGYIDGKYYVVNYFLENADCFVVDDISQMLEMFGYKIASPIIVEQDVNSNYGTYVGVLTKQHYESDPNLGGYDYFYLDFGQTVELTCDYYADEMLGILETEGISLSADDVALDNYLGEQVTVTGRVIDSGVRGGRMILVDSIH